MKDLILPHLTESHLGAEEFPVLADQGIHRVGLTCIDGNWSRSAEDDQGFGHLHVTLRGRGDVRVKGDWTKLPTNAACINPIGSGCSWQYHENRNTPWQLLFVRFSDKAAIPIPSDCSDAYVINECDPHDLLWVFQKSHRESISAGRSTVMHSLAELLVYFTRQIILPSEPTTKLADLWLTLSADLSHAWQLQELCAKTKMSPEKLRLLSHQETGRSPMRQLAHLRMRRASELLLNSTLTIEQVSLKVGYSDAFNFSTSFKRHHGQSPREYRKNRSQ